MSIVGIDPESTQYLATIDGREGIFVMTVRALMAEATRSLLRTTEDFPHEKCISAITLGACLQFPNDAPLALRAQTFGACSIIRSLEKKSIPSRNGTAAKDIDAIAKRFLAPSRVVPLLLDHDQDEHLSFNYSYADNLPVISVAESVAYFLLSCPRERKPSLNKAVYFLNKDGFGIGVSKSKAKYVGAKRTYTKAAWDRFGSISAFTLAQSLLNVHFDDLNPENPDVSAYAYEVLNNERFADFLPLVKYFCRRLREVLPENSNAWPDWSIPKAVKELVLNLDSLSVAQLEIVDRYRAPTYPGA